MERLSEFTAKVEQLQGAHDFVRFLSLRAETGHTSTALALFASRYPRSPWATKSAIPPASMGDPAWAGTLLPPAIDPLVAIVQREALTGRLNLRRVAFGAVVPTQTAPGTFFWVQQNVPKPATKFATGSLRILPAKVQGFVPVERELVRLAPGTEPFMLGALTRGIIKFQDASFLDPTLAAVPDKNPASITFGVTPIAPTGTTLAAKVAELLGALYTARPDTSRPALLAAPGLVGQLATTAPGITIKDGSQYGGVDFFATPAAGNLVIAVDRDALVYADDGLELDQSEEALIELDSAPTSPPTETTVFTSLWQSNLIAFRAERFVSWAVADANAVQVLAVS
jgi:hypothetical protein